MNYCKKFNGQMGAGGGAAVLAIASALSYLFGMTRDLFLAHFFGATNATDAYATAFLIPDFIFNLLIAGALSGVLMPMFVQTSHQSNEQGEKLFADFIVIMNTLVTMVAIFSFFLTPFLVELIFKNADAEQQLLIIDLTRIMLISPILFGISNTLASILLAHKRFLSVAIAPILYNAGILAGIIFFAEKYGIKAAAWGTICGCILHLMIRIWDFSKLDLKFHFSFNIFNENFHKVFILAIPKTLGLIAFQGMLWGYNYYGYYLEEGSIAAFNYARNIQSFSVSLFGIALATAVFPFLAEFAAKQDAQQFINRLEKSTRQILFLALPAAVGLYIVAQETVSIIFGHGQFDSSATMLTTGVLSFMALSIPFESLTHLFSRAFLAKKNTIIPMIGQFIFFTFCVSGAAIFHDTQGVQSFGISFALGATIQCLFLLTMFYRENIYFPYKTFLIKFSKTILLTIIMGIIASATLFIMKDYSEIYRLTTTVLIAVSVYFGGAFIFNMPEISRIKSYIIDIK